MTARPSGGPEPAGVDSLGVARVPVEELSHDELQDEVRRLRLRVDALRRQRDQRIDQLQDLAQQLGDSGQSFVPVSEWRRRAEDAERAHAALMATRTMRLLERPRRVYGKVLALRRRAGGSRESTPRSAQ